MAQTGNNMVQYDIGRLGSSDCSLFSLILQHKKTGRMFYRCKQLISCKVWPFRGSYRYGQIEILRQYICCWEWLCVFKCKVFSLLNALRAMFGFTDILLVWLWQKHFSLSKNDKFCSLNQPVLSIEGNEVSCFIKETTSDLTGFTLTGNPLITSATDNPVRRYSYVLDWLTNNTRTGLQIYAWLNKERHSEASLFT